MPLRQVVEPRHLGPPYLRTELPLNSCFLESGELAQRVNIEQMQTAQRFTGQVYTVISKGASNSAPWPAGTTVIFPGGANRAACWAMKRPIANPTCTIRPLAACAAAPYSNASVWSFW